MKKVVALWSAVLLLFCFYGCRETYSGEEQLIERVRQEFHLAEAESIKICCAGKYEIKDSALFWFVSGNEYQAHSYLPVEFRKENEDSWSFVKAYKSVKRGTDIAVLHWKDGYSFLVNNEKCKILRIEDARGVTEIPVNAADEPWMYYYNGLNFSYFFLDTNGNEI